MILLAEHDKPSLAAKKKRRHVALETPTSPSKNRVWNFFDSPLGRPGVDPDLSWETATGSVQYSYETASGQAYYYTSDHLGSTREMCDGSGNIVARYDYDSYGRTTLVSGTDMASFQYAGMYKHQTSGFYLTEYRAYDPTTARWLSRDPAGEIETDDGDDDDGTVGGMNLYGYVDNDPLNYYDDDGLGKEGARNADRGGHRGKKNSDKHGNAQGHGGKKKKGFDYKPKRQPDGTMRFCPLPSPGPLPAPTQPSPVPPMPAPSPEDNPSPVYTPIYTPIYIPTPTPTQTAVGVGVVGTVGIIVIVILLSPVGA